MSIGNTRRINNKRKPSLRQEERPGVVWSVNHWMQTVLVVKIRCQAPVLRQASFTVAKLEQKYADHLFCIHKK